MYGYHPEPLPERKQRLVSVKAYRVPCPSGHKNLTVRPCRLKDSIPYPSDGANRQSHFRSDIFTATPPPEDHRHHLGTLLHQPGNQYHGYSHQQQPVHKSTLAKEMLQRLPCPVLQRNLYEGYREQCQESADYGYHPEPRLLKKRRPVAEEPDCPEEDSNKQHE